MTTRKLVPQDAEMLSPTDFILDLASGGRVVGEGPYNFICPHCRSRMLTGMARTPRTLPVFRCANCRGYSRMERRTRVRPRNGEGPSP